MKENEELSLDVSRYLKNYIANVLTSPDYLDDKTYEFILRHYIRHFLTISKEKEYLIDMIDIKKVRKNRYELFGVSSCSLGSFVSLRITFVVDEEDASKIMVKLASNDINGIDSLKEYLNNYLNSLDEKIQNKIDELNGILETTNLDLLSFLDLQRYYSEIPEKVKIAIYSLYKKD